MSAKQEENGVGGNWIILMIPIFLLSIISITLAYIAAKNGGSKLLVRALLSPLNFIISNVIGLLITVATSFMVLFFVGKTLYMNITDYLDLTLFIVWGRIIAWFFQFANVHPSSFDLHVPVWHVIIFQVLLWFVIGNSIARLTTRLTMFAAGRE